MSKVMYLKYSEVSRIVKGCLLGILLAITPVISSAEIIWSGDFNDRNFSNYHSIANLDEIYFFHVPEYGRPIQYGNQVHVGNGELLSLESSPTRGSNYSVKFTVKSQAGGGVEPRDCDPDLDCRTRRTDLQMTSTLIKYYNAIPYKAERWLSISFFIPSNFDGSGSGWGPVLWGSKGSLGGLPGWAGLSIDDDGWKLFHRYYSKQMYDDGVDANGSWWLAVDYSKDFPSSNDWAQGLVDFPNETASKAALANLNRGGWTDFIFHFRTDVDTVPIESNTGFMDVYMRAGSGSWVHVLNILPMADLQRDKGKPERNYDRGVGQHGPQGYTSSVGLYMQKARVWDLSSNMVIHMDNHKIGDERATFEEMTHDRSSIDESENPGETRPMPPSLNPGE